MASVPAEIKNRWLIFISKPPAPRSPQNSEAQVGCQEIACCERGLKPTTTLGTCTCPDWGASHHPSDLNLRRSQACSATKSQRPQRSLFLRLLLFSFWLFSSTHGESMP